MDKPYGLLAELTYACPLHCPYCSNPVNLGDYRQELTTRQWQQVIAEAAELGVLQLHLSGGEPLLRRDLVDIVRSASGRGLYTNLITSGLGLSSRRAEQLRAAGLDHVQVSLQADDRALADRIAGTPSHQRKLAAVRLVKKLGWPLTLNVVFHRHNIDRIGAILDLAAELGADRVELANTQYYGWGLRNREALLPSRAQLEQAEAVVRAARMRLQGRMELIYVIPDYYSQYPKPCMGGWAGGSLPWCPTATCCLARPRTPFRFRGPACASTRWRGSGSTRRFSSAFAERSGCRRPAGAATAATSTSVAAGARHSSSPAMPPAPTRSATFPLTTKSWPRRWRPPMRRYRGVERSSPPARIHAPFVNADPRESRTR